MSSFVVSARKYRPKSFDEIIGQSHVSSTLKNAISKDQIAHAFLFCGPRGVGKTSCARILAKVINCKDPQQNGTVACGKCTSCASMDGNNSFNIIELDAASNNSVEHIRNLNEQVRFRPQEGVYKIFIIDEVHMLSQSAFNAFLKTLEEPPEYAIFILATTEKNKILPTILSRCQIFNFKRITVKDIVSQLKIISKKEGLEIEENALHMIAEKSDGAMRDALSIYDKISSSYKGKITSQNVAESLNILDYDFYFRFIEMMLHEDIHSVYLLYDQIIKNGFDAENVIEGLANHIRDLLMTKDATTLELIQGDDELKSRYKTQSELCTPSFLLSALDILTQADLDLTRVNNKHLHAEMSLSRITYLNRVLENPEVYVEKKSLRHS